MLGHFTVIIPRGFKKNKKNNNVWDYKTWSLFMRVNLHGCSANLLYNEEHKILHDKRPLPLFICTLIPEGHRVEILQTFFFKFCLFFLSHCLGDKLLLKWDWGEVEVCSQLSQRLHVKAILNRDIKAPKHRIWHDAHNTRPCIYNCTCPLEGRMEAGANPRWFRRPCCVSCLSPSITCQSPGWHIPQVNN